MKNKVLKGLALVLALATIVATLGACGGNTHEINEDAIKDYTFRVAAFRDFSGGDSISQGFTDGSDAFLAKYPESNVEYLVVNDVDTESIAAAIAAGDVWDLQYVFTCTMVPGSIIDGLYAPIDGYFDENDERLDPGSMRNAFFDGHYYGVSNYAISEVNYLSYNETMLKENGIKTPHEYLAEENWNLDSFMEICKALDEKDIKISTQHFARPDWFLNRSTKWNEDFTEVEIVINSNETRQDFDKFRTLIYDWDMIGSGTVSKRDVAMATDVFPNILVSNTATETTDTIRYIYLPNSKPEYAGPHSFFTDAAFLTPNGSYEPAKAAAVELAINLCEGRKNFLMGYYEENLNKEDFDILLKALDNGQPLQRGFNGFMYWDFDFSYQMSSGKSIATYISEISTKLETAAEDFRKELAAYREESGLSNQD